MRRHTYQERCIYIQYYIQYYDIVTQQLYRLCSGSSGGTMYGVPIEEDVLISGVSSYCKSIQIAHFNTDIFGTGHSGAQVLDRLTIVFYQECSLHVQLVNLLVLSACRNYGASYSCSQCDILLQMHMMLSNSDLFMISFTCLPNFDSMTFVGPWSRYVKLDISESVPVTTNKTT